MGLCPLHGIPLQEVVRHQIAVLVGRGAVHIPAPPADTQHYETRNSLSLVLCQKERSAIPFAVQAHYVLIMCLIVNEELVSLARRLVEPIKGIDIGLPFTPAHADPDRKSLV